MPEDASLFVCTAGRGVGKSNWAVRLAQAFIHMFPAETGFRPHVMYFFATATDAERVVFPVFQADHEHYPRDLAPTWNGRTKQFTYANGGRVSMLAADRPVSARGLDVDLAIFDEAGFYDETNEGEALYELVFRTLSQRKREGARFVFPSTPAKTWDHKFNSVFVPAAQETNSYLRIDSFQNPYNDRVTIERTMEDIRRTDRFAEITIRREYFGEVVASPHALAVPEFDQELHVKEPPDRPAEFTKLRRYVFLDLAYAPDKAGLVFGYADPKLGAFVVERDALLEQATTADLAKVTRAYLQELGYGAPGSENLTLLADCDPRFRADMLAEHGVTYLPMPSHSMRAAVNTLRNGLANKTVWITPSCSKLVLQLRNCQWKDTTATCDKFARSKNFGHFDLVAALAQGVQRVELGYNVEVDRILRVSHPEAAAELRNFDESQRNSRALKQMFHKPNASASPSAPKWFTPRNRYARR